MLKIIRIYRALREATKLALSGRPIYNGISEQALTTNFELLNLVSSDHPYHSKINDNQPFQSKSTTTTTTTHHKAKRSASSTTTKTTTSTKGANVISTPKWRRVGLVSASSVQLNTIVWPGGDVVVSGNFFFVSILFVGAAFQQNDTHLMFLSVCVCACIRILGFKNR